MWVRPGQKEEVIIICKFLNHILDIKKIPDFFKKVNVSNLQVLSNYFKLNKMVTKGFCIIYKRFLQIG